MTSTIGDLFVRLGLDMSDLASGLGAAEKRLEKFGTQMFFLGTRITAGVSLPVGAAVKEIAGLGMAFDKAMTESLAIISGVSAEMRTDLENTAKMVSTTTKFSAEEAAKGFYSLASAGLTSADVLKGALPIAARFAQAGVMDLAKATDYLATAQAAMQVGEESSADKIKDMARVADVLTEANNRAIGTIQDFAEALTNKAGAALRQSNKSIEEGVAVLAAYASQGIKGKEAGQQLWMSIRDLGIAALKHRDAFAKFGIAIYTSTGAMRNMADIVGDLEKATDTLSVAERREMFLQLGMPSRSVAATNALLGFSDAIRANQKALENAGGVTQEVADNQMKAMANQMARLGHEFQNAAIDLFKSFIPVLQNYLIPLGEQAVEVVKSMANWVSQLSDPWKVAALAVTGFVIAIGPLIGVFGSMTLLTSAAVGGLKVLASGLGLAATETAATVGVSTKLAEMMSIMPQRAALAAAAAYDAAKANGAWGAALNRAATQAANAEGWTGRVTNALIAEGMASSTTTIAATDTAGALSMLATAGSGVLTKLGGLLGTVTEWGLSFLKWKIAVDLLWPAVKSLLEGVVDLAGAAIPGFKGMDSVISALTTTWGVFNDAVFVTSQGLKFVVDATRDIIAGVAANEKATTDASAAQKGWSTALEMTPFGQVMKQIDGLTAEMDKHGDKVQQVKAWWLDLVEFWKNNGELPEVALQKQIQSMVPAAPKQFQTPQFPTSKLEPWMMGDQKDFMRGLQKSQEAMTGSMPPEAPKHLTAMQSAIKGMADAWEENSKQIKVFEGAWSSLTATQKSDTSVLDHVWQAYDTLRHSQGYVNAEMEKLFANQIKIQSVNQDVEHSYNKLATVWSDAAIDMVEHADATFFALQRMSQTDVDAFFKKNENTIQELIPHYQELDKNTQALVDTYQQWALRTAQASGALQELQDKAGQSIGDYLAGTTAKLTDAQTNLTLFSKNYADKELAGLKKGLAEQEVARDKSYRDQLKNIGVFANNPVLAMAEMARLKAADDANKKINEAEYRLGLYRLAQSVGVNKSIIRDFDTMTDQEIQDIIRQKDAWNQLSETIHSYNGVINSLGDAFSAAGLGEMGTMLSGIGAGLDTMIGGADQVANAKNLADTIGGLTQMVTGTIKAFQALGQVGSRSMRAVGGALAGAQVGGAVAGPYGAIVGAGIGALIGAFKANPDWKNLQNTVTSKWNETVSKELATTIDKDSKTLGGHVNAMMMHLVDIANESGGITAANVGKWADRLADTFNLVAQGQMSAAQGAKTLDASFTDLLGAGTTTNGLISDQVKNLVLLEQQYHTGSAAIKEFVNAQLDLVSGGFNKVAKGAFGSILGSIDDWDTAESNMDALNDKILKLQAVIADFEKKPPTNEKQKVQLFLAQRDLLKDQSELRRELAKQEAAELAIHKMAGAEGQEEFDRMGRLAQVTFDAMIGSGKGLLDSLDAIGPALDTLIAAQQQFGFTSTETFSQLMKFRDFANLNADLVDSVSGLNDMMVGLANTGFLTQDAFTDLGAQVTATFNELIAKGLTGDEAMQLMHPTLQTLWELEKKFGYTVDDATQALIDQAVESGTVGEKYMSSNDKMILALDKLIGRFDLLLNYFGVKIPSAADDAAGGINDAGLKVKPWLVPVTYEDGGPPPSGPADPVPAMAAGGILTGPRHVLAGEAGNEAIIPLNQLWDQMDRYVQTGTDTGYVPLVVNVEGEPLIRTIVKVKKKNGW